MNPLTEQQIENLLRHSHSRERREVEGKINANAINSGQPRQTVIARARRLAPSLVAGLGAGRVVSGRAVVLAVQQKEIRELKQALLSANAPSEGTVPKPKRARAIRPPILPQNTGKRSPNSRVVGKLSAEISQLEQMRSENRTSRATPRLLPPG
jgi:hypothetical protein